MTSTTATTHDNHPRPPPHRPRQPSPLLALALALSIDRPAVLALYEPLADLPGIAREDTLQRLELAASEGACVLSATASARDAGRLSSSVFLLDHGRIVRCPGQPLPLELAPGTAPDLVLRIRSCTSRVPSSETVSVRTPAPTRRSIRASSASWPLVVIRSSTPPRASRSAISGQSSRTNGSPPVRQALV